jgi:hypothetical protein
MSFSYSSDIQSKFGRAVARIAGSIALGGRVFLGRATRRDAMKYPITLLALGTVLLSQAVRADALDWKKVDAALGKTATVSGEVHRYGLPRSDLRVTLDGSLPAAGHADRADGHL